MNIVELKQQELNSVNGGDLGSLGLGVGILIPVAHLMNVPISLGYSTMALNTVFAASLGPIPATLITLGLAEVGFGIIGYGVGSSIGQFLGCVKDLSVLAVREVYNNKKSAGN